LCGQLKHYLESDADGYPLQGQVPKAVRTLTTTGTLAAHCPDVVSISSGTARTITIDSLVNLVGRTVTFCSNGVNATAHVVQFPTNVIGGSRDTCTFDADAAASATFFFLSTTEVIPVALHLATLS
jgi:hypothetical protein